MDHENIPAVQALNMRSKIVMEGSWFGDVDESISFRLFRLRLKNS